MSMNDDEYEPTVGNNIEDEAIIEAEDILRFIYEDEIKLGSFNSLTRKLSNLFKFILHAHFVHNRY